MPGSNAKQFLSVCLSLRSKAQVEAGGGEGCGETHDGSHHFGSGPGLSRLLQVSGGRTHGPGEQGLEEHQILCL